MVAPFTAAGYRVYWINRRPGLAAGTTMADVAADHAKAAREAFGVPVPVLGHGTGGLVGLQLALDHPDTVDRLVVAGAAHALGPVGRRFRQDLREYAARGRSAMHRAAPVLTGNRLAQALLTGPLWLSGRLNPPPADHADMDAMLLAEERFDIRDRLGEITVPTLIAWGEQDRLATPEMFHATARGIPAAREARYPRAGHSLVTTTAFVRDALDFLRDG
ncbi:alpha/beta fold hydrolase [Actinoplanes missouriensis]|uniref:alpha/beta fold hydrolase n=1 Tax=Actinoplanes missouriensis TaxID=1866 RepID=UPI00340E7F96